MRADQVNRRAEIFEHAEAFPGTLQLILPKAAGAIALHLFDIESPDQRLVAVIVHDPHDLPHARALLNFFRQQGAAIEAVNNVTRDGIGFEQLEPVMFECGDATEGLASAIVRRDAFLREDIDLDQVVWNADLLQHQTHDTHVDAVGSPEKCDSIHGSISAANNLEAFYGSQAKGNVRDNHAPAGLGSHSFGGGLDHGFHW
jgi:hypothetical protein